MRIAVIKESECQAPENCDYICAEVCPRVREGAKETVYARENGKAAITESLCISCGICVKRCPFDAIRIINLPDEMMKDVTFQYGINTFRTFNIATPIAGKVLGLIGRNGIGKTTNINLISGSIKPNFGEYKKEFTDTEIIRRFRGKDIQPFLEKLYSGTLRIAKKPQEFTINGHVREYLKKDRFGIVGQEILGKEASVLSGGESQLVEIARTMDEEEDTYIFDEPMNYLDVFNRIKVAQMIKEKLKDKTVVLVEHDLIMLDYMADFIQILYGSDSNYGIVSHIMPTRNGINNYISGYLPTENVRFREYQIKIKKTANLEGKKTAFKWPDFSVDLGNFRLDVSAGSISEGEIVGIIGRNGIGKSTFIKALAGLVKTSLGDLDFGARIAYKPQINRKGRSMTVDEAFEVVKA
ncbi:ATP-binding cassette domain-containing protein [Candidatus Parvarchaeota archaeon]|nr:ATP-binding cassette domain-containing protein [Candidatus Parvarchaeota archaeon]